MAKTKRGRAKGPTNKADAGEPLAKRRSSARNQTDDVVVAVKSFRKIGGVDHYQVEWSSSSRKDSWEPAKDVRKVAKSLVDEFENGQSDDDDDREYEVEKLLDRSVTGKGEKKNTKYLVLWKGYSSNDATWESAEDLPKEKVRAFEKAFESSKDDEQISQVKGRKTINNVLHYEIKLVGQTKSTWTPIFEISDVEAIKAWEEEQFDENQNDEGGLEKEVEYTVEKIINRRGNGKSALYRVKWVGYPTSANTWEPLSNLEGSKDMVRAFDKEQDAKEAKLAEIDYEIEKIVAEKMFRNKPVYLVRWKGYKHTSDTWEPESQFKDAEDVMKAWEEAKVKKAEKAIVNKAKREERKEQRKKDKAAKKAEEKEKKPAEESAPADEEKSADAPAEE